MIRFALPFAAALALATPAFAQPQISRETLQRVTQQLSSDEFQGRAPGTEGETRTVELIAREFERAGLQPGNNGSWFQDVPLVEITARGNPELRIGGRQEMTFNYRRDFVGASYRAQPRVSVENSDIVFVGYGINAPERGWNDYEGLDVRGKTVIILVNDPDWNAPGLEGTFGGRAMTYYGRWTYKYEEAARQGAAAAFIVHDTDPASYGWMTVENSWTGPQLYMRTANGGADQTAVNGWLTNEAARRLLAAGGQDLDALTRAAQQRGFRAVPLAGLTASISVDNAIRTAQSRNVIGVLPGTSRADEYVLYTAHWDHLGVCREDGEDRICNGATDNATGTAALVALAEANVRAGRTPRSQVFVAVTAEESGLLGSAYYAAHPIYPLARTAGGINIDSLQMTGDARDAYAVGAGKSELDAFLQRAAAAESLTLTPEPAPQAGYYYRSDHFSLAKLGVPMVYAKLGPDLVNGGRTAGLAAQDDYRANRYHGPADEYDPNWDWSGALHEVRMLYRIGRDLAESEAWPNWNEGDEFRAIRDRSRAGQ